MHSSQICSVANYVDDGIASARHLQVSCERPLADTPMLDRADAPTSHARHFTCAPIRLACHSTKISLHVNANMMRSNVIVKFLAVTIACETSQCHAWLRARTQVLPIHV